MCCILNNWDVYGFSNQLHPSTKSQYVLQELKSSVHSATVIPAKTKSGICSGFAREWLIYCWLISHGYSLRIHKGFTQDFLPKSAVVSSWLFTQDSCRIHAGLILSWISWFFTKDLLRIYSGLILSLILNTPVAIHHFVLKLTTINKMADKIFQEWHESILFFYCAPHRRSSILKK